MITSSKIYIINQKTPVGRHHRDNAKDTEGGGNNHLTKDIREKYGAEVIYSVQNFGIT